MRLWAAMPLGLQAVAMLIDELYFHRKRGLPRWERVGHPIDTLSVLICYAITLSVEPTQAHVVWYVSAACFSCLLITKDELVHAARCAPLELWLHSVLFVLHPVVLATSGLLWLEGEQAMLRLSAGLTALFGGYQLLYWNVPWKKVSQFLSITRCTTTSANDGTPPTTIPSRSCARSHASETPG
jgi:hypothetical protein